MTSSVNGWLFCSETYFVVSTSHCISGVVFRSTKPICDNLKSLDTNYVCDQVIIMLVVVTYLGIILIHFFAHFGHGSLWAFQLLQNAYDL